MLDVLAFTLLVAAADTAPSALRADTVYAPAWSPDGKRITFEAKLGERFAVMVMNADGTGLRRLTESTGSDFATAWSPDGRRIAFMSTRDGNREIYVMDADGGHPTRLTRNDVEDA